MKFFRRIGCFNKSLRLILIAGVSLSTIAYIILYHILNSKYNTKVQVNVIKLDDIIVSFTPDKIELNILAKHGSGRNHGIKLRGLLHVKRFSYRNTINYFQTEDSKLLSDTTGLMMEWDSYKLVIKKNVHQNCTSITWLSRSSDPLEDCFELWDSDWFGGPEYTKQLWPIQKLNFNKIPYVPSRISAMSKSERYWLNSEGVYIYIDKNIPLFVDMNHHEDGKICFISDNKQPYQQKPNGKMLQYHICALEDPRKAQEHAIKNFLGKPTDIPDENMIKNPIWSTWVRYKKNINEKVILDFSKEIIDNGFRFSNLEIDDEWETCYGSTEVDTKRFPDMRNLVNKLHEKKFKVTIWTHTFVNTNCPKFKEYLDEGYIVKSDGRNEVTWWNGKAGAIDFTNPAASEWFVMKHLKLLTETGIDGFKFDAGESDFMPGNSHLNGDHRLFPIVYTRMFLQTINYFNKLSEVRVTSDSRDLPFFVRMLDKDSRWSFDNGLPTLITTLLVLNIQGYPWILPDMIGGNAYDGQKIDKELLIRWLQATTFMPALQFSVPPWDYDTQTIEICKKFVELHYKFSDKIIELMKKTVKSGAPLNPPIWWVDPTNKEAHKIDSQYLLGEEILVAPVLEKGESKRDIYLPKGNWKDGNKQDIVHKGPKWLTDYEADISTLPYFFKV